jgi:type II secretory pathway pseudopilin PulG
VTVPLQDQPGQRLNRCRYRGFSFTEILFAVIVLGIGFIMIAAIFPVAIQQGKLTAEQGSATAVAREALSYLGQVGSNSDSIPDSLGGPLFRATGTIGSSAPYRGLVYSMRDPQPAGAYPLDAVEQPTKNTLLPTISVVQDGLWHRLNLSLIVPSDPRYAFVGLYRRDGDPSDRRTWSPFVQCWFIPVTTRSRSIYNAGTLANPGVDIASPTASPTSSVNLQARLVKVQITDPNGTFSTTTTGGYVLLNYTNPVSNYTPAALSENCYIIIANDESAAQTSDMVPNPDLGRMNGHIYHVGLRRPDLDGNNTASGYGPYVAYDLVPDGDFAPDCGADGLFGVDPNVAADAALTPPVVITSDDDILAIGNATPVGASKIYATGPADAYVVGLDASGAELGTSQDISAFTTFIKVN